MLFVGVAHFYHSRLADSTFESMFLIYDLFLCLSTYFIPSDLSEAQLLTTKHAILGKPFVAVEYLSETYTKVYTLVVVPLTSIVNSLL